MPFPGGKSQTQWSTHTHTHNDWHPATPQENRTVISHKAPTQQLEERDAVTEYLSI